MTGIRPYDRRSGFLYTDDIVKVVDYNGDEAVFIVARHESIGQHSVRYTQRIANGGIPAGQEVFAEWRCLQPARENRLFELRPFIFGVREVETNPNPLATGDGRLIFSPTPLNVIPIATPIQFNPPGVPDGYVDDRIPVGVELRWKHPTGVARLGTDLSFNVDVVLPTATITTPNVGGVNGGFVDAVLTPLVDDFSDLWRLNAIYGQTIELGIANRTNLYDTAGTGRIIGGVGDRVQYFIGIVGRKHLLGPCPEKFYDKVMNEEIPYKTVTIGGVPIVSTRA
jgi:hypothetical protein